MFSIFSQEEEGYSRNYEGTGIGLALIKKYCELNHLDAKTFSPEAEKKLNLYF